MFSLARLRKTTPRRSLWSLAAPLAWAACSHELRPPQQSRVSPSSTSSLDGTPDHSTREPVAPAQTTGGDAREPEVLGQSRDSPTPKLIRNVRCHTPAEVEQNADLLRSVRYRTSGELSVVGVVPGDALHLRAAPDPSAASLAELAFDARGIHPLGSICTGGGSPWFEVEVGATRGWVNSQFVDYATPSRDASAEYASLVEGLPNSSHETLLRGIESKLRRQHADMGPEPEVTRVGSRASGASHFALIQTCCFGDDSVRGEQVAIELVKAAGSSRLVRASLRTLCYRGESAGLCL